MQETPDAPHQRHLPHPRTTLPPPLFYGLAVQSMIDRLSRNETYDVTNDDDIMVKTKITRGLSVPIRKRARSALKHISIKLLPFSAVSYLGFLDCFGY